MTHTMNDRIAELKQCLDLSAHPYFRELEHKTFDREDFIETQVQFMFAVVFFSRPIAVLASRMPRPEMRMSILHDVFEEHAEEFYEIIRSGWQADERARYQIEQGLELGAYIFSRLYRDLYEARAPRREVMSATACSAARSPDPTWPARGSWGRRAGRPCWGGRRVSGPWSGRSTWAGAEGDRRSCHRPSR